MKKITILLLLISSIQGVYAQKDRKKKGEYSKFLSQTYYVLKEDKSIKDGPFERTFMSTPIIQGQYKKSIKAGIWSYYNSMGDLLYKYDYSSDSVTEWKSGKFDAIQWGNDIAKKLAGQFKFGKVVPYSDYAELEYKLISENDKLLSKLDRPPLCLESNLVFQLELFDALRNNISDFQIMSYSLISFEVDTNGNSKNFKVVSSTGSNFEIGFIKQLEERNIKWIPAQLNNRAVAIEIQIPIIIKTRYDNNEYIETQIIFTDSKFMDYYQNLEYRTDYKHLQSWDYKLFD